MKYSKACGQMSDKRTKGIGCFMSCGRSLRLENVAETFFPIIKDSSPISDSASPISVFVSASLSPHESLRLFCRVLTGSASVT